MFRLVTVTGLIGIASAATAEPVRMTGDDIKRVMVPGAVLEIDTPLHIGIPVKVAPDGIVSAEAGALGLTLGALKDRGRYWTDGDKLCMKWFRWFDAKPRCMTLQRDGNKVYWSEGSGETGTATITEATPVVAAVAPIPPKKRERVETAAVADPTPHVVDSVAPAAPETPSSDTAPALQFAAAALGKALPGSAPGEAKASRLGMDEPTANEETAAPVHEEAAPPPSEEPAPRAQAEPAPPPRKVKAAHVAPHPPAVRKSAPKPQGTAVLPTPGQVSFRVAGVGDGDTLNVRSGPSEYHPSVGRIPPGGSGVQIVGACREEWCPVRHGRLKGWVNRYYLAEDVSLRR
jgi:hypothetical protein